MDFLTGYLIPFLVVLTILVFVHELGHYWVARRNGVRVEVFSIGFGPEIFGWTDRAETRWKISWIPLGGYVRFHGDEDAISRPARAGGDGTRDTDPDDGPANDGGTAAPAATGNAIDHSVAFHDKRLGQRAAIVAAGPLANFFFAIFLLAALFGVAGQPYTAPEIGDVRPDSAAAAAGLQPGDRFLEIDGSKIERFEEIQQIVRLHPEEALVAVLSRDGERIEATLRPRMTEVTDRFGTVHRIGLLGVTSNGTTELVHRNPLEATWLAAKETVSLTSMTLTAVGQIIAGSRTAEELGGPIRIAQMSGQMAQTGWISVIYFMALLSINLGLINLFPVPMLDGGHLLFYGIEALRGRPLGQRAQEYGFRIGFALVLSLMLFATWNDLVQLRVVEFVKALMT